MKKRKVEITKTMTIEKVLSLDENVVPIFLGFGLHCLGCPMSRGESLEEACFVHGVDCDLLVEKLNAHFQQAK